MQRRRILWRIGIIWIFLAIALFPQLTQAETSPIALPANGQVTAYLSDQDIPSRQNSFYKDYVVQFNAGEQIAIDLTSDEFDTIVTLLGTNGNTIAENDDGSDGSTNSLLFTSITRSGEYTVRVRAFGETAGGKFTLKLTRLRPVY